MRAPSGFASFVDVSTRRGKLASGVFVLLVALGWVTLVAPQFVKIPEDFSYQADVVSIDNFYDEKAGAYAGEQRSVTAFEYRVVSSTEGAYTIKNTFDVRTVSGENIVSIQRLYGINPMTGAHVAATGDQPRSGYLFAPRMIGILREQEDKTDFVYWHVNYDAPAIMHYVGSDRLFGLPVYHYQTHYEGSYVDQTSLLTDLPDVPEKRGVVLDPTLDLWIEPVTGRLVKYADATIAYYYDRATGKRLSPWNAFHNQFSYEGVHRQVLAARHDRAILLLVETVVPLLLILIACAILLGMKRPKTAWALFIVGTCVLIGYGVYGFTLPRGHTPFVVGISEWRTSPEYEENIRGFKEMFARMGYVEGRDISYLERNADRDPVKQREIISDFLERDVSLIFTLTTPGSKIAQEMTTTTPIVFSLVTYPMESGLVSSLSASKNNLVGASVWIPMSEQLKVLREFFPLTKRIAFLHDPVEPSSQTQLIETTEQAPLAGYSVVDIHIPSGTDVEAELVRHRQEYDVIYKACDSATQSIGASVTAFALQNRIPTMNCTRAGVVDGDQVALYADPYTTGNLAASKAALIFDGATPSSLETSIVLYPSLIVNASSSAAIGVSVPQDLAARAAEVIYPDSP